jgi:hypothetical protein
MVFILVLGMLMMLYTLGAHVSTIVWVLALFFAFLLS